MEVNSNIYGFSCGSPIVVKEKTYNLRSVYDSARGPTGGYQILQRECFFQGIVFCSPFSLNYLKLYPDLFVFASKPNQECRSMGMFFCLLV